MNTVLKYPGSKWSTAEWIISKFPIGYEDMTYLEPFFGSGAIFFNKNRSKIETINDLDGNIVNLFKVIRDSPDEFIRQISLTPWARDEYKLSYNDNENLSDMELARRFMVRLWQAIGGKTSDITGWSNDIKPTNNGKVRWVKLEEDIILTANRLKSDGTNNVQIENQDALKLLERYDRKETFAYLDPPYLLSTRSKRIYKHEYKTKDHIELLELIKNYKGKVMISGYDNDLYNEHLEEWNKYTQLANTEMGKSATEVIWLNYEPPQEQLEMGV